MWPEQKPLKSEIKFQNITPQHAFLIGKPGILQYKSGDEIMEKFVHSPCAKTGCSVIFG